MLETSWGEDRGATDKGFNLLRAAGLRTTVMKAPCENGGGVRDNVCEVTG